MAPAGLPILLLSLALVTCRVYGSNGTDPQCDILSTTGNVSSAFNLTVSPETLSDNTDYTVWMEGSGNFSVILQALSSSGAAGNWSEGNISCNGSPLFLNPFENGNRFQAQWKSPGNATSVNITAHIHNENGTFIVSRTLNPAATNLTTIAPSSSSSHSTANSTTATTATTPVQTTSGGCAVQTNLLTAALVLLAITSLRLS